MRPSRRHANIVMSRARHGHDEDQLARALGITRETMRGWAKKDKHFADALQQALQVSSDYWLANDERVNERDEREAELAKAQAKRGHMAHRQRDRTSLEAPQRVAQRPER